MRVEDFQEMMKAFNLETMLEIANSRTKFNAWAGKVSPRLKEKFENYGDGDFEKGVMRLISPILEATGKI